jgi:hypothetical protein
MADIKWSSFTDGGSIASGDEVVGLRSGNNVRMDATSFETIDIDNININGNIISSTDTNGNIQLIPDGTGQVEVNDPGLETSSILVDGASYETAFRVNDIGGTAPAQMILHRHSTTWEPILLAARSNSNTSSHATVTSGQSVLTMYGAGWLNSYYGTMASITMSADTSGTIADGSAPGRIQLKVTPNGSLTPVAALTINNSGTITLANALPVTSGGTGLSSTTANQILYSSANNTIAGLATANNSLLVTSASGVPSLGTSIGQDITINSCTAGQGLVSGSLNTAFGISANAATTTAQYNTAFGYEAIKAATTGGLNVAMGYQALVGVVGGTSNTAIGTSAGKAVTSGGSNVIMGSAAGFTLTTGSNNTFIGRSAGATSGLNVGTTTASNNIFIGFAAGCSSATGAGTIAIGFAASADPSTGSTSATNGPGISIGSASALVGFRGDGTAYTTAGASAGYWRVKINGTNFKIQIYSDS